MKENALIRVWTQMEVELIKKHLLVAGELSANCENCQHLGIDFTKEKNCPECKTVFHYLSFRKKSNKGEELSAISRFRQKRADLMILDYEDVKYACGKSNIHNLFKT